MNISDSLVDFIKSLRYHTISDAKNMAIIEAISNQINLQMETIRLEIMLIRSDIELKTARMQAESSARNRVYRHDRRGHWKRG